MKHTPEVSHFYAPETMVVGIFQAFPIGFHHQRFHQGAVGGHDLVRFRWFSATWW